MSKRHRKRRIKKKIKAIFILLLIIFISVVVIYLYMNKNIKIDNNTSKKKDIVNDKLVNYVGNNYKDLEELCEKNNIDINIKYEYSDNVLKDMVISQDIDEGTLIKDISKISVVVSLGSVDYSKYSVNELGEVPIMMYHGIVNKKNSETSYTGGNVDKDGYNRTVEAFRSDLEFYYKSGYRMIRLTDYIDGIIDVELGYSPIIITFDDGNENNFHVLGKDSNGELIIDPNCAVGVLEEFKKKYPDYNVTATFFVNGGLFNQEEYNADILKWMVKNGYDIGNHTMTHVDFKTISTDKTVEEVGGIYKLLDSIIPDEYVNIIALPFGSPYSLSHSNYKYILDGDYNGYTYHTKGALRVGWKANESCYDKEFDPTFMKRIRAYDNNGVEFDIEMNFDMLEDNRYISDGIKDTIVIKESDKDRLIDTSMKVISY